MPSPTASSKQRAPLVRQRGRVDTLTRTMGPVGDHSTDLALSEQTEKDILKSPSAPRTREEWIHDVTRASGDL